MIYKKHSGPGRLLGVISTACIALLAIVGMTSPAAAKVCRTNCLTAGDYTLTIPSGGMDRTFLVHVPASYTGKASVPLLIDMHGWTSNAQQQRDISGQLAESDTRGFIAVWPEGYSESFNAYNCCGDALKEGIGDVAFLRAVVENLKSRTNINDARVYATGLSNGGVMAMRFACEAADVVTAVVAVSQMLNRPDLCRPSRPVSVTEIHGLLDVLAPYGGQSISTLGSFQSARQSFASWATLNHCSGDPLRTQLVGLSRIETFTNCASGVRVGLVTLATAGHVLYSNAEGFNSAKYMWESVFI